MEGSGPLRQQPMIADVSTVVRRFYQINPSALAIRVYVYADRTCHVATGPFDGRQIRPSAASAVTRKWAAGFLRALRVDGTRQILPIAVERF